MNKIKQVSLFFRIIFQIILVALPIFLLISWIYAPNELVLALGFIKIDAIPASYRNLHLFPFDKIPMQVIQHSLTLTEKIFGFLISAIPMLVEMFIVYCLIKLFKLYEQGEIFSLGHVKLIRNIAYALLITQIIEPFYQLAMGLVLTLNNPPHHHVMAITLSGNNVGILLASLLMILISWIMTEAYKLKEEQQFTI